MENLKRISEYRNEVSGINNDIVYIRELVSFILILNKTTINNANDLEEAINKSLLKEEIVEEAVKAITAIRDGLEITKVINSLSNSTMKKVKEQFDKVREEINSLSEKYSRVPRIDFKSFSERIDIIKSTLLKAETDPVFKERAPYVFKNENMAEINSDVRVNLKIILFTFSDILSFKEDLKKLNKTFNLLKNLSRVLEGNKQNKIDYELAYSIFSVLEDVKPVLLNNDTKPRDLSNIDEDGVMVINDLKSLKMFVEDLEDSFNYKNYLDEIETILTQYEDFYKNNYLETAGKILKTFSKDKQYEEGILFNRYLSISKPIPPLQLLNIEVQTGNLAKFINNKYEELLTRLEGLVFKLAL